MIRREEVEKQKGKRKETFKMGGDKLGGLERKRRRRGLCSDSHISAGHR